MSASRVAGTTGACHLTQLIFVFFVEMRSHYVAMLETGFCHVAQAGLEHFASSDPPISASQVAGITDVHNNVCLIFCFVLFLVEMGFHHVGQAGLELRISDDLPDSASQSAGITGMSHRPQPGLVFSGKLVHVFSLNIGVIK